MTRQVSPQGNTDYQYDLASRRTRLTWPDAFYVTYDYLVTGEVTAIRENGAASGPGVLATYSFDNLGRRVTLTRGNGTSTNYSYDAGSRLTSLTQDLNGTANDQSQTFSFNPSSQIVSQTRSNDAYAFTQAYNANRSYTSNGLNQYTLAGVSTTNYDSKGNLTSFWGQSYGYSSENLLTSAGSASALAYDPLTRFYQVMGATATRFGYDGSSMIAEYNTSNALQRRYVPGPGVDEPIVWYEGSGTSDRRWMHADERGSVTAITNGSGNPLAINSYDEYGMPATGNIGRFGYTGQMWLAETGSPPNGLYNYKARAYFPRLGRFMQTDPIGFAGGMNLYNYVGSDPVNHTDPGGTDDWDITPIIVTGRLSPSFSFSSLSDLGLNFNIYDLIGGYPAVTTAGADGSIVVTALHNCDHYNVCSYRVNAFTTSILSGDTGGSIFSQYPIMAASSAVTPQMNPCEGGKGYWDGVASRLETFSDVTGAGAFTAAGIGLALAPTGAGFAIAETIAGGLGIASTVASFGAAGASYLAGNNSRAAVNFVGAVGGFGIGKAVERGVGGALASGRMFGDLSASQTRQAAYVGGVSGAFGGKAAGTAAEGICVANTK